METKNAHLLILLLQCLGIHGYISGAPDTACNAMYPGHGSQAQTGSSGVAATVTSQNYGCGDIININLYNTTIKGFICQTRTDPGYYATTGELSGQGFVNKCNQAGSLTHSENSVKNEVTFQWRATDNVGDVTIVCSIVEDYKTFWVKESVATLTNTPKSCPTTPSPSTVAPPAGNQDNSTQPDNGSNTLSSAFRIGGLILLTIFNIWNQNS